MTELPWWKRGVIYEIAVASFADSDGDGTGDLRGIIGKLDYLNDGTQNSLGVDAIWLTPINPSPMLDFGYDVTDHRSIDPRFGTLRDLDDLLEACHARGIRVMMDLVLNHTSDQHPWFRESCASLDNPRRDWYVWRDGRAPRQPPNRWLAAAGGSAWAHDASTGQYYYHAFLPFQPDLNWRNPQVSEEMFATARSWLDKGVDGFRLDLINFLVEDASLRDNPRRLGIAAYFRQHHVFDRSRPESLEIVRGLRRMTDDYPDRALMGEVCTDRKEDAVAYLGDGCDALHLAFYLDFAMQPWNARRFRDSVEWMERHIAADAWPCYYLDNHDLPRTFTRLGRRGSSHARAKVVAAMLLTLRGTPLLYYGEEIGMPAAHVRLREMRDPLGRRFWPLPAGRDASRTPMQWTAEPGAGFTTGVPWLPVDRSSRTRNVAAQLDDPASLLSWYRQLIHVRAAHVALHAGSYRPIDGLPKAVFGYLRETPRETAAVLLNFRGRPVALRPAPVAPNGAAWATLLSTHAREAERERVDAPLHAYEARILLASS